LPLSSRTQPFFPPSSRTRPAAHLARKVQLACHPAPEHSLFSTQLQSSAYLPLGCAGFGKKKFSLPIKAKLIERICFVSLPKIFRFASFSFFFASFHFRFTSDAKTSEKTLFSHRSEKISLPFRFILLRSENDGSFSRFTSKRK
jgi:hypothetical protein